MLFCLLLPSSHHRPEVAVIPDDDVLCLMMRAYADYALPLIPINPMFPSSMLLLPSGLHQHLCGPIWRQWLIVAAQQHDVAL